MLCQQLSAAGCDPQSVLVVGGGVAGMHAALRLSDLGIPVLLVERNAYLGGMVMRLDKVYPTDHCAFCPTWTTALACYRSALIQVALNTEVTDFSTNGNEISVSLRQQKPAIDPALCLFCGACRTSCPSNALLERDPQRTWDPALPPSMSIDPARCNGCGHCVEACPVNAIDLSRQEEAITLPVGDVLFATGFEEPKPSDPRQAPEFGVGSHPDILTAMEFEAWYNETLDAKELQTRSTGRPAQSVAFIQCAGARDQRHLPYCAAVCCMHAMKQARWLKRRNPNIAITIFYTDLRAPGAGQERYMRLGAQEGIRLLRARPGLVMASEASGIGVRYEQPESGQAVGERFDLVVVNGGLAQCRLSKAPTPPSESKPVHRCGFCAEPADVATSVIQGAAEAYAAAQRRRARDGGAQ
ncbi:MAG: 4Fe-4S binding protein [Desulfovibrio sp.]|nr:4Fe-4S binding protein [Desulfovibrio sp.]